MDTLSLRGYRVLISGAGVAGPALALALSRYGASTTVVEVAPALRTSGFGVDFRGPTHMRVLSRLGVLAELRDVQTHAGAMSAVDEQGREIFRLPEAFAGGEVEVHRRDLSRIFYEHTTNNTEYLFGDSITGLTETPDGVLVEFAKAQPRTFDLVVGADGLHSAVRRLTFGDELKFVKHLGYYLAGWDMPNKLGAGVTPQQYNVPGRMASITGDQHNPENAGGFAVFASPRLDIDMRDIDAQKKLIIDRFADLGWHVPHLLDGLRAADELYFDSISRVSVPNWTQSRVVLLGDAAWGVTLGGMGVGTGVVGGYVLAGELAKVGGDHRLALPEYERLMRGYASRWQRGASPGHFLAPSSKLGLWLRNKTFRTKAMQRLLVSSSAKLATKDSLPEYA